ncbi:hypothetical protein DFJ58DRAFT_719532 [Suillus subalutaceus]|uniref:uncharacterized protein n=1 Tax=Suillus subalutaceus TaxID=48586 RepID=UPI001B87B426|nr:uncharacterized protein DFJ58DRAFT_719532 [Suillus subalutaceus]KAG1831968.1 hypothetical protein DFJ58DRAFT_719532 [Suillus subalutaceus]
MKHDDFEAMREHNAYYPFTDRAEWELAKFLCDNLNQGQITRFLKLLWVVHHIFGNPIFANHMEYDPYEIKDNGEREYGEWMSCEQASEIQTPVTRQTGSLEMHPTFLTLGNIHSEVRMKATSHAWACIAYIPVPEYIVNMRVWHKCMDLVLEKLKVAAEVGEFMVDPMGCRRYAFTPLAAHIADLPEQIMIACITDPWKVREFQESAKQYSLSGVHQPYWRNWGRADPSISLSQRYCMQCHKFFFDHPLKWCKEVIGASELDARFRSQHKRVGTRHFTNGVSHVNQMTGREHHDIQRTLVPTIVGVTSPGFTPPTFTSSSLDSMVSSLNEFHAYKHFILEAEARTGTSGPISHFQIPKLESFNSFARSIRQSGAIIQFSADVSERLLITHCKTPFQRTSHQRGTFTQQIVNIINREEVMRQFDVYALLRERRISLINVMDNEFDEVVDLDPTFNWIARVAPQDMHRFQAIRPVHNHFLKGLLSDEANAAFHVTIAHDLADRSPTALAQLYHLSQFPNVLSQYLDGVSGRNSLFHVRLLKTWYKFRLQTSFPTSSMQHYAKPANAPFGNCDMVLLQPTIRMVFMLSPRGSQLPTELKEPLLYVELFEIAAPPEAEPHIGMYRVRRSFYRARDGSPSRTRIGKIVRLVDVTHAVELIPIYGETMDRSVSSTTSLERYDNFYLNAFSDKEWYHTLHADLSNRTVLFRVTKFNLIRGSDQ